MRPTRTIGPQSERGFALWEMMVLLAVLALFLAGVIVLASKGIESLQPKNADRHLSAQGELLMDRLQALTREAIVIYAPPASDQSSLMFQHHSIRFAADLDGEAPKSAIDAFVAGGGDDTPVEGIEDISVTQLYGASTEIVARVTGADVKNKEVILTKVLDARHPPAFRVEYEAGDKRVLREEDLAVASPDLRVTGLHVYLKLEDRGKTLELDRAFRLNNPAPVRAAWPKDK